LIAVGYSIASANRSIF